MNKKNIIIHVHIFKNAGSSFDDALMRNFKNNFVDHREDHLIRTDENFFDKFLRTNDNIEAFSSHSIFFKPKSFMDVRFHIAYMLRHPIERIKSVYTFEVKQPAGDSLGAKMAKQFNFQEYISWRMQDDAPPTIRNLQTKFLAGMGHNANYMNKKYEQALKTLYSEPLVGIVDRYDESMVVFEEYLKTYFPNIDLSYIRRNVTDKNIELSVENKVTKILSEFDESLVKKINEKNYYDLTLYTKANTLLEKKINQINDFENKLFDFRGRCENRQGFLCRYFKTTKSKLNNGSSE